MSSRLRMLGAAIEARYRLLLVAITAIVFVGSVFGVVTNGSDASSRIASVPSATAPAASPARTGIEGFGAVAFEVTKANGEKLIHCGLLADTEEQRSRGLMGQNDIGGYDAMVFAFPETVDASFYMANVPVPLTIAWFDDVGRFVSSTAMEPCRTEASECPLYPASGPYRYAVETREGGLDELGADAGSTIALGGACT